MGFLDGVGERLLGDRLDVPVDGQADVLARARGAFSQYPAHPALVVHLEATEPLLALQDLVVGRLDARLPDDVADLRVRESGGAQLVLGDLARVAQNVRGQASTRVDTDGGLLDSDTRELRRVLDQIRRRLDRDVDLQEARRKTLLFVGCEFLGDVGGRHPDHRREPRDQSGVLRHRGLPRDGHHGAVRDQ
jgi:hypothetical protein